MICPHCGKQTNQFNPKEYQKLWRKRNPEKVKAIQRRQDKKRSKDKTRIANLKLYKEIRDLRKGKILLDF